MHYFLDPSFEPLSGSLSADESRHALKSLRLKPLDVIAIGDGKGTRFTAEITGRNKELLTVRVMDTEHFAMPSRLFTVAVAPTKNPSRFEWFLEKATELGVDCVVPVLTERTLRPHINVKRAERILTAAAKQSQRPYLPQLSEVLSFGDAVQSAEGDKFIAHCDKNFERKSLEFPLNLTENTTVLIGPEGDFSPEEISMAQNHGFRGLDLGVRRLRTETAAVFATALFKGLG